METWCVVVPREQAEAVRRRLRDDGLLLKNLKIRSEGDFLLLPTSERADIGSPTRRTDFEEAFAPSRSYRDAVRVPEAVRPLLPRSFDVIGDIAVLKIPEELGPYRSEIGASILTWNPRIRVVAQDRGVAGAYRVRQIEIIAGERRTTTAHVEHGLRYHVDVARAYFSPRLAAERLCIAEQVRPGETVADPFAGVGPYAILIARRRRPERVIASDANPDAVSLLHRNVRENRAGQVVVREGDARGILAEAAPLDRIILDLPHAAFDYLADAFESLSAAGVVHLYGMLGVSERIERLAEIRALAETLGRRIEEVRIREVRAYSPSRHHVAFDVTVGRG